MLLLQRFRGLPLRTRLVTTAVVIGLALLGVAATVSLSFWSQAAYTVTRREALLTAGFAKDVIEASLLAGDSSRAQSAARRLTTQANVVALRLLRDDGQIIVSAKEAETGTRDSLRWLPAASMLGDSGLVRLSDDRLTLRTFVAAHVPTVAILEVDFSLSPLQDATRSATRLGLGFLIASLIVILLVFVVAIDREVFVPLTRARELVVAATGEASTRDDVVLLVNSVSDLVAAGAAARAEAEQKAGFAEVGQIAAEMAHEFKRPLASALMALSAVETDPALPAASAARLADVRGQFERLTETMRDVFALARPDGVASAAIDLEDLTTRACFGLAGMAGTEAIEIVREFQPDAVVVRGDPLRLEQALTNVLANAVEAMPTGGRIAVRSRRSGALVQIAVQDSGCGMDADACQAALRPFATTKVVGTGLGLPLVARILAAHGGSIDLESTPGAGTTVTLRWPGAISP